MASVVAKVYRGSLVESVHYGDWVICDAQGRIVFSQGDPHYVTFFRSAAKPIQAIPIVELGVADAYGFTTAELAVMCASHSGEAEHVQTVQSILNKIGLDHTALQCGIHLPKDKAVLQRVLQSGQPINELYNNCSGKHAGMLAICMYQGWDINTYTTPEHPLQQLLAQYVSEFCQVPREQLIIGVDGCGVPVFGCALDQMARAYARLVTGEGLPPERAQAAERVTTAMRMHPSLVAGSNQICTDLMRAFSQYRLVAKAGAEAVYCVGLPDRGWGLALKIEDGNSRAISAIVLAILKQLGYSGDNEIIRKYDPLVITNHHQQVVGMIVADIEQVAFERVMR